jgi:preprotein translocase subunit SecF
MNRIWQKIAAVSAQTWLYLFVVTAVICVFSLRHNNQTMIKLRQAVYSADQKNGDVNAALNSLRRYVYGHMNTNLSSGGNNIKPPIQLKYTYQRLYDTQSSQVQNANQQIYTDAELYCQSINNAFFGTTRVPCVQNYVINHGIKAANITIPAGLYEFDFISPTWSPDLAGFSLLATIILLAAFLLRFGLNWYHKKAP